MTPPFATIILALGVVWLVAFAGSCRWVWRGIREEEKRGQR